MLDLGIFWRGFAIGLAIAAPVGAIGLLCIRRTLAYGRLVGFVTGLGAATADAFYGAIAALGLTSIAVFLANVQAPLRLLGGAFLIYLGWRTYVSRPEGAADPDRPGNLAGMFASTFALTLANPSTIISFAAIFAGLGLVGGTGPASALLMVAGVFLGSATWWLILSGGIGLLRGVMTPDRLLWVNRASGVLIALLGVGAMLSVRA
ncbi:MAG: LysE family transporter [Thermomicrobiales bacterium]|nr:LysE family transporter [Thermomicrobiales bacterium]MCA9879726.1 LysE family transporter [Thermomicrobiales bacterium]